jgi:hypothetical protein
VQLTLVAAGVVVAAVLAQSVGGPGVSLKRTDVSLQSAPTGARDGGMGGSAGAASSDALTSGQNLPVAAAPLPRAVAGGSLPTATSPRDLKAQVGTKAATPVDGGGARVVMTGSISLIVDDGKVNATVARLREVAKRIGGYISAEQSQEFGSSPSATVTLRVPVAAFEGVLNELRSKGFGAKVVSAQSSGKDVTAQYADTAAQIASLKAARGRFLTILAGARTIGETLTVQQRVDDVQGQIDRLEGARRVLADQSDWATLTVTVGEHADAVLKSAEPTGLSKAWDDARHGFTSGVEGLIARSGRALLVLLVAAVALLLARFGWRLARRRLL